MLREIQCAYFALKEEFVYDVCGREEENMYARALDKDKEAVITRGDYPSAVKGYSAYAWGQPT